MASRDVKSIAKYSPARPTYVGDRVIIVAQFIDLFANCILCQWLVWLLHKQDTYNKPPFLTVLTTEKLFLAQAVVPSVVPAKYRELIAKMAVLSSKHQTDFSHKFRSTKLVSDIKLNFLVLVLQARCVAGYHHPVCVSSLCVHQKSWLQFIFQRISGRAFALCRRPAVKSWLMWCFKLKS